MLLPTEPEMAICYWRLYIFLLLGKLIVSTSGSSLVEQSNVLMLLYVKFLSSLFFVHKICYIALMTEFDLSMFIPDDPSVWC